MTPSRERSVSRRAALTGAGVIGVGFLAACSGGGGSDSSSTSGIERLPGPQRLRAEARSLEPAHYVKTYAVDATGRGGAHRTFAEAYEAVATDRQARLGTGAPSQSNPWDWRLIRVAPGTYHESIKDIPPHTAVVGTGKAPEDVHIWWDGQDNTFESTGRSTYVRNVHLDHTGPSADAHPMRDSGSAGDIGMQEQQRRTVVYENVRFSSLRTGSLGKCTNDMAPTSGCSLTFHRCVFDGPGQPQSINLVTNQGAGTARSTISFLGCTVISNHEQHPSAQLKQDGDVSAAPFGAPDFSHGRGDRVLWLDGHWDVGRVGGVQGLLVFPYIADSSQTKNARPRPSTEYVLVNPGEVPGLTTVKTDKVLPPRTTVPKDLRLPRHGLGAQEQAFFGAAPPADGATLTSGTEKHGTVRVTAGDVYWMRIALRGQALFPMTVSAPGRGGSSVLGTMLALDDHGSPQHDGNGQTTGQGNTKKPWTATVQPRWFYPGQGPVWVGVTFQQDAEVPATTSTAGGAYRAGGAQNGQVPAPEGLHGLPAGTPIPYVEILNQRPRTMS